MLMIFRFSASEEIDFDLDLREIQDQELLDEFCDFLRTIGRHLGKPVLMSSNAVYFELEGDLTERTAVENVVIERPSKGDIVLDFDADGRLLGVEVIGATELLSTTVLDSADRI